MEEFDTLADRYFSEMSGSGLAALLAPISDTAVAGASLSGSATFAAIRNAREEPDASLPLGAWEHELKRADWAAVSRLCVMALRTQSKDLQLAAWLLESEIRREGFGALAPCLGLIGHLCERYWQEIHPLDLECRDNIFRWMADRLRRPLRHVAFTASASEGGFGWADWEQAMRNEQIRVALGKDAEASLEGARLAHFSAALAATPASDIQAVQDPLAAALTALTRLDEVLARKLGNDAPLFDLLRDLIENILLMLASETRKRGPACADPSDPA